MNLVLILVYESILKNNNKTTRAIVAYWSNLIVQVLEQLQLHFSTIVFFIFKKFNIFSIFIVGFKHDFVCKGDDNNDVVLVPLLLTLKEFYLSCWCFHSWIWTSKLRLGLLLTLSTQHINPVFLLVPLLILIHNVENWPNMQCEHP